MNSKVTLRTRLFLVYSSLIFVVMILASAIYYTYTVAELKKSAYSSLRQSATNISTQMELKIRDLDAATMKVIMSPAIRETLYHVVQNQPEGASVTNLRTLTDTIYSIMGPMESGWQINLIHQDGVVACVGEYSYITAYSDQLLSQIHWLESVYLADGSRVVTAPHADNWGNSQKQVISVSRCFGRELALPKKSVVEVQQKYTKFEAIVRNALEDSDIDYLQEASVLIYDREGELIYPLDGNPEALEYYRGFVSDQTEVLSDQVARNPDTGKKETVSYAVSEYTGWTTVMALPESIFLRNVNRFLQLMLSVFGVILLATMAISFVVAKGLSNPIRGMYQSIKSLDFTKLHIPESKSKNELVVLEEAFQEMCDQLDDSIQTTIATRSKETEARMVALQSQMNPHMLYNTVSTIHILAEEQGNEEIVHICDCINGMFKYILSDSRAPVTMREEVEYIERYFSMIRIRFGQSFACTVDVDSRILNQKVPKLILQPFVENATKHGAKIPPPWKISIIGTVENDIWTVRIQDNGPGFDPEFIERWKEIRSAAAEGYGSKTSHGLGLKNTYERLQLFFGADMIFKLFNPSSGGACVLFGSIIRSPSEEMTADDEKGGI